MAVRIKLDDLTPKHRESIRKCLYMQPKSAGYFKQKRFVNTKNPILMYYIDKPNGEIVLPYTFGNSLIGRHINSSLTYPASRYSFLGNLRPNQVPVSQEALGHLNTCGTTTLGLYPGFGKTILSAYLASKLGGLTLIVFPSLMIKQGWISTFEEYTNAKVWVNDNKNDMPSECNVILTMDTSFHKIPKEVLTMVSILVIDEAHLFCTPSRVHCLLGCYPKYVIACTATLDRSDGMHSIIHAVCGKHQISKLNQKRFSVYRLLTGIKTDISKTKQGNADWAKLVRDLAFDPLRNAFIVDLIERNSEHKIMVLTWNKEHAVFLKELLVDRGISADVLAGNKSTYTDSRVLVGTISKVGTGFDEKMACLDFGGRRSNMMILTGSTKSLAGLEQIVGRVFRAEYPTIIDFVDNNRISKSHWYQRRKWYEDPDRNGEILYVDMKKDEGLLGVTTENNIDKDDSILEQNEIIIMHNERLKKFRQKQK